MDIICNNCSGKFRIPDEKIPAGRVTKSKCPKCRVRIVIDPTNKSGSCIIAAAQSGKNNSHDASDKPFDFMEEEGLSLVLTKTQAERQKLSYVGEYRAISLKVFSSLDAVGMTAAISAKLTQYNISANVIAAFNHDHVFVNAQDADEAFALLANFS